MSHDLIAGFFCGTLVGIVLHWSLAGERVLDMAERVASYRIWARQHEFLPADWQTMQRIVHGLSRTRKESRPIRPIKEASGR